MLAYDDQDPDFCKFNDAVDELSEMDDARVDAIAPTASMLDYFQSCDLSESMMKLADAGYANTAGSDLADISWRITCRYERQWIELEDDGDYRVVPTFNRIVEHFQQGVNVQLQFPVAAIDYSDASRIIVTSKTGERLTCRTLVVTVPTSVFLDIAYTPSLPPAKQVAVESFGMRRAAKVLMHFTTRFWPSNTHGVICSDSFVPEFWVNSSVGVGHFIDNGDATHKQRNDDGDVQYLVTGFAGADCADRFTQLAEEEIVARFLEQLDAIYGTELEPKPASKSLVRGKYFDWGDVDYIRGGYSFPRVGQSDHASKDLAEPIEKRIFFAGEATSFEQPGMTVHSAMDTGTRAAEEVAAALALARE
jgi:monoamine oxidase